MTEPNSIGTARTLLREAVAEFQTPSCETLTVSPWVAMSLLQKAIRRGRKDLALRAAATLLKGSPERLWRRHRKLSAYDPKRTWGRPLPNLV